jgi:hypothetical protein
VCEVLLAPIHTLVLQYYFFVVSLNCVDGAVTYFILFRLWLYNMSLFQFQAHFLLPSYLNAFKYVQMHSLQHPEVFIGMMNGLWAEQLRIL